MIAVAILLSILQPAEQPTCAAIDDYHGGIELSADRIRSVIDIFQDRERRELMPLPSLVTCSDVAASGRELDADRATRRRLARSHLSADQLASYAWAIVMAAENQSFVDDRFLVSNRALLKRFEPELKRIDVVVR